MQNFTGSLQQMPTFQSQSSSDIFNINSLGLGQPQYGSSPNLCGPQVQTFNLPPVPQPQSQMLDVNDPNLQQQVDSIIASLSEYKRPMLRRQVITVPAQCQGRVANITRRLPTPAPDIIERITVIKPPRDIVNLRIEKPTQPEPCFQSREICGKQRKPLIQPCVVTVPPRTNACAPQQTSPCCPSQQQPQYQPQQPQQPIYQQFQQPNHQHSQSQQFQPQQQPQFQSQPQHQFQPQQFQPQQFHPQQFQPQQQFQPNQSFMQMF